MLFISDMSESKYHQGTYVPKNPQKYVGDINSIRFRSSWERKLMVFLDNNPSILKWSSEETIVPYISPIDQRPHRYFLDFTVKYKTRSGEIKTAIVEVKPEAQTKPPVITKNKRKKTIINETKTWHVNKAKWEAATAYAKKHGIEFMILTEKELKI